MLFGGKIDKNPPDGLGDFIFCTAADVGIMLFFNIKHLFPDMITFTPAAMWTISKTIPMFIP